MKKIWALTVLMLGANASQMLGGTCTLINAGVDALCSGGTSTGATTVMDFGDGGGDPTVALTFSPFTPCEGCTLISIEIDLTSTVYGNYGATNSNNNVKTFTVTTQGTLAILSADNALTFTQTVPNQMNVFNVCGRSVTVACPVGSNVISGTTTATSTSSVVYNADGTLNSFTDSGGGSTSDLSAPPVDLSAFLGTGPVTLNVKGLFTGGTSGSGFSGAFVNGSATETATVLYTELTPEPGTMALFGSALLGIGFWGRKRLKK